MTWWARLWRQRKMEEQLDKELLFHLDQHTADLIAQGLDPEEARRRARLALGGPEQVKEKCRDARGIRWLEDLLLDIRYGARMLLKSPGFTLVTVITLALSIGANTAIFSTVNAVLLKPLPYHEPDRLVVVWEDASFMGFPMGTPAPANYADWSSQNRVFEAMAAIDSRTFNLISDGDPERIEANGISYHFFPLLGINPILGSNFLPTDDQPDAPKVTIISYRMWMDRYGADRNIVGHKILLDGQKYTIVGVMPRGFQFLEPQISLWVPIAFSKEESTARDNHYLNVIARLRSNVTREQANAEMRAIMANIARDYPKETAEGKLSASVQPLSDQITGDLCRPLLMLFVAVSFVLLIACANIGGLLLARALARSKEVAVRVALGAGRWRIARQVLTESLLLALVGGGLGVLFAFWAFAFLKQLIPPSIILSAKLELSGPVLIYTLAAAVIAGLFFGTAPAFQAAPTDLNDLLKQGSGRLGSGVIHHRLRNLFVIGEIALTLILLAGAGLMIRTFINLRLQFSGLNPEKVLTMQTTLLESKYSESARRLAFYDRVLEQVKTLPHVTSAGYTTAIPLAWSGGVTGFTVEGRQDDAGFIKGAIHRQISVGYLPAVGIALHEGRDLAETDNQRSTPVAIINKTMAQRYWPNESAVGKRLKFGLPNSQTPWMTVVGVMADVRQIDAHAPVRAEVLIPYRQAGNSPLYTPRELVVRTTAQPLDLVAAIRRAIQSADPSQPISEIRTMDDLLGSRTTTYQMGMTLLAVFASLAALLAALGIYGALSYFVAQHRSEICVRMTVGAQTFDVLNLVISKGMKLALIGIIIGLIGAFVITQLIESLLFGVSATDPLTFAVITLLLAAIALVACWIPAWRATKVDPITTLRSE
jgi:putative ABC transport system permease protein